MLPEASSAELATARLTPAALGSFIDRRLHIDPEIGADAWPRLWLFVARAALPLGTAWFDRHRRRDAGPEWPGL